MDHYQLTDDAIKGWLIFAVIMATYFIPWIVAHSRGHQSELGIFIFNFTLGWTILSWLIALIWACTGPSAKTRKRQREAERYSSVIDYASLAQRISELDRRVVR